MATRRPLMAGALTLGIGMGGFLDGIVFHQLLQFHNMLSAKLPPTDIVNLEINMFWDGVFHLACWAVTAIGLAMVWHAVQTSTAPLSTPTLIGSMMIGWGLFNLVEGIVDHHVLHLHHVVESPHHLVWDLAFLGSGVLLVVAGLLVMRASHKGATSLQARQSTAAGG